MDLLRPWIASASVLTLGLLFALLFKTFLARRLRALAQRTETEYDDILIDAVVRLAPLWAALAGAAGAAQSAPIAAKNILLVHKTVTVAFFLSATFALSRVASATVRSYSKHFSKSSHTTGIVDNLVRAVVLALGGLLVLSNLGISVTPILGALGVTSLAVALALQDTLTNFFAGLHVIASEMVGEGDYIRLEGGQEGFVYDVGWRMTRLREAAGNEILLPNSKLANSIVVNYHQPAPECGISLTLAVSPRNDLEKVEKIAIELAQDVQANVAGAVNGFAPSIRFLTLDAGAVKMGVNLKARTFPDRFLLIHEYLRRAHARFRQEGIELAFPDGVVRLQS